MEHQLREYFLDINKALCSLIVTDREGKEVDPEEGMRKWINRIREMRDVSGCMFLCGIFRRISINTMRAPTG